MHAREQGDLCAVTLGEHTCMASNQRQFPCGDVEVLHDLASTHAPQHRALLLHHASEVVALCKRVEHLHEPGEGVGQRAVNVEDHQVMRHDVP